MNHSFSKLDGKVHRNRRYYGGVGVLGGFIVERWDVPKKDAKVFDDKASAQRLLKKHNLISDTDWVKINSTFYKKDNYQIKKLKETEN